MAKTTVAACYQNGASLRGLIARDKSARAQLDEQIKQQGHARERAEDYADNPEEVPCHVGDDGSVQEIVEGVFPVLNRRKERGGNG